jgi:hypothetical protein
VLTLIFFSEFQLWQEGREGEVESKEKEGIICFSEKEADKRSKQLDQEGYNTKIVKVKDGRYIIYTVGEKWEWPR